MTISRAARGLLALAIFLVATLVDTTAGHAQGSVPVTLTLVSQTPFTGHPSDVALSDLDGGAPAQVTLGLGSEEFRLSGFPSWHDEDQIVRAVAGVRYRTTGTVTDDFYRMEASTTGTFRAPAGHAYTPTDWNFYTPIVGGGGPNAPAENPDYPTEKLLVRPNVAKARLAEVIARRVSSSSPSVTRAIT